MHDKEGVFPVNSNFQLPGNQKVKKFLEKLSEHENLVISSQQYSLKSYYDSFDWRLYRAGLVCELNESKTLSQLSLMENRTGLVIESLEINKVPAFVAEMPDSELKKRLQPILEMRALLSLTSLPYQCYRLNVLNKDEKTVARLIIEEYETLPAQVAVLPVRGYDKASRRMVRLFTDVLQMQTTSCNILQSALKLQGRKPMDYSSKLSIQLDPSMRADIACKYIYSHLLQTIKTNEVGTITDIDSEFLHDFRVAVRRTRSGLSQLKEVLPFDVVTRYQAFFAWLGQITGHPRDMDVYLLNFEGYRQSLPEPMQLALAPLRDFLRQKRSKAKQELAAKLKSQEYRTTLDAWEQYLKEPVAKKPSETHAMLSIKQLADKRIWKVYRRVIKEGSAISEASPAEALHELRKTCKKLRYLMEFFQCMYTEKKMVHAIKTLKKFQDILGDYQDFAVQQEALAKFGDEMRDQQIATETFLAMGVLVQNLHQRQLQAREEFAGRFADFKTAANQAEFKALFSTDGGDQP